MTLPWLHVTQGTFLPQPTQQLSLVTSVPHNCSKDTCGSHGSVDSSVKPPSHGLGLQQLSVTIFLENCGWEERDCYLLRTQHTLLFSYSLAPSLVTATLFRNG